MASETNKVIRIEGEAVVAIEEVIHRRTTLPEWLAAMNKLTPTALTTPVLPEGTCLFASKGRQQLVAINQPATVKKVIWRTTALRDLEDRARTRWQLAIPPHLFLLIFQEGNGIYSSHMFYTETAVTDKKQMLFKTNLANIYSQGIHDSGLPSPICTGNLRLNVSDPLAVRCKTFIEHFWASEFNDDIQPITRPGPECVYSDGIPATMRNLNEWDKATEANPDFLTKLKWPFAPLCSLEKIVNELWQVQS